MPAIDLASVEAAVGTTRVLVVDDHRVFADAIAERLGMEPDLEVVAAVTCAADALAVAAEEHVDLALLDVELGQESGVTLGRELRARAPYLRVVMVTAHDDLVTAADAIQMGARGWVPKDAPSSELISAVRAVRDGATQVPSLLLTGVLDELSQRRDRERARQDLLATLTDRERDVLDCMVHGLDRAATARKLYLSINTVRTHTQNVMRKLGTHSTLEAVAMALSAGIRADAS